MKKLTFYFALALTIGSFTACGDDNPAPLPPIQPTLPATNNAANVTVIKHNGNAPDCYDWIFNYADERLTSAEGTTYRKNNPTSYTSTITYHPDNISVSNSGNRPMDITLNNAKLIEEMTVNKDVYTFHYNNGRLSAWTKEVNDDNFGASVFKSNATISYDANGDLSLISYTENDNPVVTYRFTPDKELNRNGLLPETVFNAMGCFGFEQLFYAGLMGRPTTHLVKKIVVTGHQDPNKNYTVEFEYATDDNEDITLCNYAYKGVVASVTYGYAK